MSATTAVSVRNNPAALPFPVTPQPRPWPRILETLDADSSGMRSQLPRRSRGTLAPWQINRVRAYVEERISSPIALDELARIAKLSTSYFSAAFKTTMGIPPHNYIVIRRVEFAKYRMLNSDAPLCEIALDCGLADQAHLSRIFRRVTGTTPSAWRRALNSTLHDTP